jgi:hypothetical protein
MSFPVSVEPEEAIPRIFFETMVEIAPEIAKTQGASMGRKISRLTPDRQSVFWLAFLVALNKCFGEALYSTHSFWKVLLINGINPLDICYAMTNIPDSELTENHSMVRSDYFWMEMLNPEDPLYNILPDDRTIEFYSDRMGRWDEIISQALSLKTNYVKPNFEIGIPETKPYSRLMRVAISSLSLEEFIQSSKHFTPSITSWVEYLKSTSTDLMAQKAANLLRNVIDAGGYHVKTSINPDSSPEKVSMTLDLIAGLGITQGEWEADHFKFNEWLQMYFPYGIGALPIATSAMRLNNDSLTVDTLGAMIYFYQNATPLFEMIPRNRQLEFFGKAIRCQIGLGIGQSIDSLHKLASIIDWYWDFFFGVRYRRYKRSFLPRRIMCIA